MSIQINRLNRRRWTILIVLALLTAALIVAILPGTSRLASNSSTNPSRVWPWSEVSTTSLPTPDAETNVAGSKDGVRNPTELRRVLQQGSFAGTTPVGSWCVADNSTLLPCLGLRDRFEYYINGLGEITSTELRLLIEDEAKRAHGDSLAAQIMAIYDRYWQARNLSLRNQVNMADVNTWLPALEEAQRMRLQILGPEWSLAFFSEEEQEFRDTHRRATSGTPPPPSHRDPVPLMQPGIDPEALRAHRIERYGQTVAAELEVLDAKQLRFDQHLVLAKAEWRRLRDQGHLSDSDRRQQIDQFIAQHFDPQDHRRVSRLLDVSNP